MSFKFVSTVFAQGSPCGAGQGGSINLGDCLKLSDSTTVSSVYNNPAFLVNLAVRNIFVLAGVVLFLMFFLAGYKFITKGKDGIEDAKRIVTMSMLGFSIMFAAFWIVQLVSLLTGVVIPGITIGS
ncbi:MAG: hypothetical protein H6772_03565 [Pseudomonadales bacterium]|nr:hypothetical protein [Pseudomonadales bacterium]